MASYSTSIYTHRRRSCVRHWTANATSPAMKRSLLHADTLVVTDVLNNIFGIHARIRRIMLTSLYLFGYSGLCENWPIGQFITRSIVHRSIGSDH